LACVNVHYPLRDRFKVAESDVAFKWIYLDGPAIWFLPPIGKKLSTQSLPAQGERPDRQFPDPQGKRYDTQSLLAQGKKFGTQSLSFTGKEVLHIIPLPLRGRGQVRGWSFSGLHLHPATPSRERATTATRVTDNLDDSVIPKNYNISGY
jgi:hypothetical protein